MARREQRLTIAAEGRDKGKVFLLREMPASQAERWAMRAFMALGKADVDIPPDLAAAGLAGIAALGVRALGAAPFMEVEPLLGEMMTCVQAVPDPSRPEIVRLLIEDDIEEVATRIQLREAVIELHTGFSVAAALSSLKQEPAAEPSN